MTEPRFKLSIQGSGVLQDGSKYTRELSIFETVDIGGLVKESFAEKIEVAGEVCEVKGVRVDRTVVEEDVKDNTIVDPEKFEEKWEKINWLWTRTFGHHVPQSLSYRFGR